MAPWPELTALQMAPPQEWGTPPELFEPPELFTSSSLHHLAHMHKRFFSGGLGFVEQLKLERPGRDRMHFPFLRSLEGTSSAVPQWGSKPSEQSSSSFLKTL